VPIVVSMFAFVATGLGGLLALRARDRLHLILGFSAGVLLGLVAFELLPEVFDLSPDVARVPLGMITFVGGFLVLHIVERAAGVHETVDSEYGEHSHAHHGVGLLGAGALIVHSFLDGLAIGLAFQVSSSVGWAVAIAVLAHDFADGLNTVTVMLRHGHTRRRALELLVLDAVAPILGAIVGTVIQPSTTFLAAYLGAFAGFLTYLATADILPEAHSRHPSRLTLVSTVGGVLVMWAVAAASAGSL